MVPRPPEPRRRDRARHIRRRERTRDHARDGDPKLLRAHRPHRRAPRNRARVRRRSRGPLHQPLQPDRRGLHRRRHRSQPRVRPRRHLPAAHAMDRALALVQPAPWAPLLGRRAPHLARLPHSRVPRRAGHARPTLCAVQQRRHLAFGSMARGRRLQLAGPSAHRRAASLHQQRSARDGRGHRPALRLASARTLQALHRLVHASQRPSVQRAPLRLHEDLVRCRPHRLPAPTRAALRERPRRRRLESGGDHPGAGQLRRARESLRGISRGPGRGGALASPLRRRARRSVPPTSPAPRRLRDPGYGRPR